MKDSYQKFQQKIHFKSGDEYISTVPSKPPTPSENKRQVFQHVKNIKSNLKSKRHILQKEHRDLISENKETTPTHLTSQNKEREIENTRVDMKTCTLTKDSNRVVSHVDVAKHAILQKGTRKHKKRKSMLKKTVCKENTEGR